MIFIIINLFFMLLAIGFILTKRFWQKNTFSLVACTFFMIGLVQPVLPDDNIKIQIAIIITTILVDALIIGFLLAGRIAGTRFSHIVQDRKTALVLFCFSLVCFLVQSVMREDIYVYANMFILMSFMLAPFVEEYVLRGIIFLKIQGYESLWKRWVLYVAISMVFAFSHIILQVHTAIQLFYVFLLSISCFAVRELWRSKYSFSVVWLMHLLYNALPKLYCVVYAGSSLKYRKILKNLQF